jgi:F-type H+-transporting ATPase subunit 8
MEGKRDIRGSNITLIKKNPLKIMPQLTPFYFVNEVTFAFAIILITIYMLSKYILPRFVRLFLARTFISKLFN